MLVLTLMAFSLCSCVIKPPNEIISKVPETSSKSDEIFEQEEQVEIDYDFYAKSNESIKENEYEILSKYSNELCFTFEVPDLSEKDFSELPYLNESFEWCVNGTDKIQLDEEQFVQVLFEDDEEAATLAKAIALLKSHHGIFSGDYGSKTFDSITAANGKELIWTAICQTPQKKYSENKNHALNSVLDYIYELSEHTFVACEIYSETDVEKTFRWFFGEEPNFVPQNIEMFGIRYFEELGVFVQFFDGIMMMQSFPQIISYTKNGRIYTVEVIFAGAYQNGEIGFDLKLTDGTYGFFSVNRENVELVSQIVKPYVYTFEKAEDGHFLLTGFSY